MSKSFPQNCQAFFHAFLYFGVLTGLLFSCGEGIRLFPFPQQEISSSNETNLDIDGKIPYQSNAHRLEEHQGNYKTKSQRNCQHHYWLENNLIDNSAIRVSGLWKKFNFSIVSESFQVPLFSNSGESRAPPFTV